MKPKRTFPIAIVATVTLAILLVMAFLPKPLEVDLGTASRASLVVTVREDGQTRIREKYIISSPLAGKLRRVPWKPGDPVENATTILAVVEPRDPELLDPRSRTQAEALVKASEAQKSQAAARLEQSQVAREFAAANLERARSVYTTDALSFREVDEAEQRDLFSASALREAEFGLLVATYELEQAKAVLLRATDPELAKGDIAYNITSPISGRVLRVFQESATVVTPGTRLLEVGNPDDLEIEADILSMDAVRIKQGAKVTIANWGGPDLEGRVRVVEPSGFTKISALGVEEQRVNVLIDLVDPTAPKSTIGDGFRVEVEIVMWEGQNILTVPTSALFRSGETWAVYAVTDGRAKLRPLEIGQRNDTQAEVLSGLREGEQVVLYPGDTLEEGIKVKPREK